MKCPPMLMSPLVFPLLVGLVFLWLQCMVVVARQLASPGKSRPYHNLLALLTGPAAWAILCFGGRGSAQPAGLRGRIRDLAARLGGWQVFNRRYDTELVTVLAQPNGTRVESQPGGRHRRQEAVAITLARQMVDWAVGLRASDILLDPRSDQSYQLRFRVDGLLRETERIERETALAVVNCFKIIAGIDIAERRRAQDGSLLAYHGDREIKLRLATAGTVYGEKIAIRVLDSATGLLGLDQLGLSCRNMDLLRQQIRRPHGMVLVCGPTGSGKSTTLYAAINELTGSGRNIITIEDPIEYTLLNASQTEINTKAGITFASQLRHVLRQSPDVILVGEIRDAETAHMALQASETGHLVFSTLHSNDAVTGLIRLIELGIEPHLIAASVACLLSQRLVRRLCPNCRRRAFISDRLNREAAARRIFLDNVYEPAGCAECDNAGYRGREGIFEFLPMSAEIDEQLRSRPTLHGLQALAKANGMITLRQDGVAKVLNGTTSMAEVIRVTVS
jgi:type II secretory ATPase GspE/PulE/Tfp pilus assembly ATPase PilB-like protein